MIGSGGGSTLLGRPYFHRKHLSASGFKRILFLTAPPRSAAEPVRVSTPPPTPLRRQLEGLGVGGGSVGVWGGSEAAPRVSGHGLLPRESPVVERVHVDDLLGLDDDGRLGLLFEAPLTLQRDAQLIHHGAAERPLQRKGGGVG